jgi:phenylacetate-coenzyme A ligase PaaK-like adenylate-forming protein
MLTVPITPLEEWTARRLGVDQLTRSAVERWQLEQLREVVAWARQRSPFYRELYRDLPDGAPQSLDGLARLPFVEHTALRDHGMQLLCVSLGDISRVVTVPTSGSTGPSKRVWFTDEDLELTIDHFRHGMRALVGPGDRVLVLMPGRTPGSVGALLEEGLRRDGIEADSYGFVDRCQSVADRILEYRPDCLVGVPGQILRLARSSAGQNIPRRQLRSVLFSGDDVATPVRKAVEAAWDCRVFEHYGSTELGLGGAVQCRALAGLHVREADLLFEVIHPVTGKPVGDGAEGELIATTLTRRGMPLIRYRTGDLARMAITSCPCGSVLRCLKRVVGRKDDLVELSEGTVLTIADLNEAIYAHDSVLGFTAVLDRGPRGDRLTVRVDARDDSPSDHLAELTRRVLSIPSVGDSGVDVVVEASQDGGCLPPSAKQRIVDSRRAARP